MQFSNIKCKSMQFENIENTNLMKVTLSIVHPGLNDKGTFISENAIRNAEESIKNKPILAYILRDDEGNVEDFDTHNMDVKLVEVGNGYELKTHYVEVPIGVISESCNPRYVNIDGIEYFQCDGYVWRNYGNGAAELIEDNEFKSVSMEIQILDGEFDKHNDIYTINNYVYEGVTVLGDHVLPGIGGAKIQKYSVCTDYKDALADIYKEIYSLERKEASMETEVIKEEVVEEVVEEATEIVENNEQETVMETIEETEEQVVEVEENVIEETEEVVEEETESLDVFSNILEEVPSTLKEVANIIGEKFSAMNEELNELREFKSKIDLEELKVQVDEISNKYELDVDTTELKEKAITKDITLEQFEKELKVLFAEKVLENGKFSKEIKEEPAKVTVTSHEEEKSIYGGLFEKHGLK